MGKEHTDNRVFAFTVPGIPVPQPRPRASRRGEHIHVHSDSPQSDSWKAVVQYWARKERGNAPMLDGPLGLLLRCVFPYRSNTSKCITLQGTLVPKDTKPDWDNLGKAVCDALTGVLCSDDGKFCRVTVEKYWGPEPGVLVEAFEI